MNPAACRLACTFWASVAKDTPLMVTSLGILERHLLRSDTRSREVGFRFRRRPLERLVLRQRAKDHRRDDSASLDGTPSRDGTNRLVVERVTHGLLK